MADLVRTLEADLFGAYAWAADFYQELLEVPEPEARALVAAGLARALDALERGDTADEANRAPVDPAALADLGMRAAEALAAAEDATPPRVREQLAALAPAREGLFSGVDVASAEAFVEAFRPLWARGPREPLVVDALAAALALSNVIASRKRSRLQPPEERALHAEAAALYEDVAQMVGDRVGLGEHVWADTAAGCLHRAARVWHLAGDAERAKRAAAKVAERAA